jgi:hypothetical protein
MLNDKKGAIADFRQAAQFYKQQGDRSMATKAIEQLEEMGVTAQTL